MIKMEQKIEKLEKEVKLLKKEITDIRRIVKKEIFSVIIERISVSELTKSEKKALAKAMEDFRKGRKENFVELEKV